MKGMNQLKSVVLLDKKLPELKEQIMKSNDIDNVKIIALELHTIVVNIIKPLKMKYGRFFK